MARKPFKAVPLRAPYGQPRPAARRQPAPRKQQRRSFISPIVFMLPLAVFTVVFFHGGPRPAASVSALASLSPAIDGESAAFGICSGPVRVNCVVDGDTFWYAGEKIRVADINAPEVGSPACAQEAALGARATSRFLALLNAGPFTLAPNADGTGRDHDSYGRALLVVTRGGQSLGDTLVAEGLAEEWRGYRRSWC